MSGREPYLRVVWVDNSTAVSGYLVIDTLVDRYCAGGVRMSPTVTLAEVEELARIMTYKYMVVDSATGGAKAGIAYDPAQPDATDVLARFFDAILPLLREYFAIGEDLGTTHEQILEALRRVGRSTIYPDRFSAAELAAGEHRVNTLISARHDGLVMSNVVTGYGVAAAADQAWRSLSGSMPATVGIQGFGSVGGSTALYLARWGYSVVAISDAHRLLTKDVGFSEHDIAHLLKHRTVHGEFDPEHLVPGCVSSPSTAWLDKAVDILIPAATSYVITGQNANQVRARLLVEGANAPCTPEAEDYLHRAGVLVIPDMVANAGAVAFFDAAFYHKCPPTPEGILAYIEEKIRRAVERTTAHARLHNVTPRQAAETLFNPWVRR